VGLPQSGALLLPPPDGGVDGAAAAAGSLCSADVLLRSCGAGTVTVPRRVKAVRLEGCIGTRLALPHGAVATLELLRCERVVVQLGGAVSAVRLDDCRDVALALTAAAAAGHGGDGPAGAAGCSVYTSGCHSVRVAYPESGGGGGGMREVTLPEMLHSRLLPGAGAFASTLVTPEAPWGAAEAARPSGGAAGRAPAAAAAQV